MRSVLIQRFEGKSHEPHRERSWGSASIEREGLDEAGSHGRPIRIASDHKANTTCLPSIPRVIADRGGSQHPILATAKAPMNMCLGSIDPFCIAKLGAAPARGRGQPFLTNGQTLSLS